MIFLRTGDTRCNCAVESCLQSNASSCNFTTIQGASVGFSNKAVTVPLPPISPAFWLKCLTHTCTHTQSPSHACTNMRTPTHILSPKSLHAWHLLCKKGLHARHLSHLLGFWGQHFVTMARNADARVRLQCHLVTDIPEDREEFHLVACLFCF